VNPSCDLRTRICEVCEELGSGLHSADKSRGLYQRGEPGNGMAAGGFSRAPIRSLSCMAATHSFR